MDGLKDDECPACGRANKSMRYYTSTVFEEAAARHPHDAENKRLRDLLNHIHREVASLEDFDAKSLMEEIEKTLNGTEVFDDNKFLHEQLEKLEDENVRLRKVMGKAANLNMIHRDAQLEAALKDYYNPQQSSGEHKDKVKE